jgi:hypothetical protein
LCGCNSIATKPLSPEHASALSGKTIALAQRANADFTAMTAGKTMFGPFGVASMENAGNAIARKFGIDDPARQIGTSLTDRLIESHGMFRVASTHAVRSDRIGSLIASYPGTDYLLDVKTIVWMMNYLPSDWSRYRIAYGAHFRLIDAAQRNVIAEMECRSVQGEDDDPPSMTQLLQNQAALLKEYVEKNGRFCSGLIATELLGLPESEPPPPGP